MSTMDQALRAAHERGMKIRGTGICWFTRESYARLLEVADDRDDLAPTFEGFLERAGARFDALVAKGHALEKVLIDVDDLVKWCRERGIPNDVKSRGVYTAYVLMLANNRAGHA